MRKPLIPVPPSPHKQQDIRIFRHLPITTAEMLSPQAARAKQFLLRGAPRTAMDSSIEAGEVKLRGAVAREDLLKMVKALRQNAALGTIEIEDSDIGNEGAKGIAEALKANDVLMTLSLCNANITGPGASHLAEALKGNRTLRTLKLCSNKLGHIGIQRLASGLRLNISLRQLDLSDTAMDKSGAQQIAEALFVNTGILIIRVRGNPIGTDGALAFANAIRANSVLIRIDLSDTDMDEEGLVYIIDALQINQNLKSIEFPSTLASSPGALRRLEQMLVIPHPKSQLQHVTGCELSQLNLMIPSHVAEAGNEQIIRFLRQRGRAYRAVATSLLRQRGLPLGNLKLLHEFVFGEGWDRFSVEAGFVGASPRALSMRLTNR